MRSFTLALVLVVAAPLPALAFKRSTVPGISQDQPGPCLFWQPRTLPYVINDAGAADIPDNSEIAAVRTSFSAWTDVGCSDLNFADRGLTPRFDVGYAKDATDNINLVVWRDVTCLKAAPASDPCWQSGGCNNKFKCWEAAPETIAVTTTTFNNKTGEILDADIELNGAGFVFTTLNSPPCPRTGPVIKPARCVATDVGNTVTHEAGHFLGLDHTEVLEATMFRSAETGEISKRSLEQDDQGGLCAIYPAGKPTVTCVVEPKVAVGSGCACSSAAGLFPLLAGLSLLALSRRRLVR